MFICPGVSRASSIYDIYSPTLKELGISSETLQQIAREKGIIPQTLNDMYGQRQGEKKNSIIFWIVMKAEDKLQLIDRYKGDFEDIGVIIRYPSGHYVEQINNVIYHSILNDTYTFEGEDDSWTLFKTISIMEGDYDDGSGRSKIVIMEEYLKEEGINWDKDSNPKDYKYLIELENDQ
jgi:hypothetical protein